MKITEIKKAKTAKCIIDKIVYESGGSCVINHDPTESNPLGQSSLMTLIDDIQDVVELNCAKPPSCLNRALFQLFTKGIVADVE